MTFILQELEFKLHIGFVLEISALLNSIFALIDGMGILEDSTF